MSTLAERVRLLAALETYAKLIKDELTVIRPSVLADMQQDEIKSLAPRLSGQPLATVAASDGNVSAVVTDMAAAIRWVESRYPQEIIKTVNPAFLKALTDYAKAVGKVGDHGVDTQTGERLDFIEVKRGTPYLRVTTTEYGVERMRGILNDLPRSLTAPEVILDADA